MCPQSASNGLYQPGVKVWMRGQEDSRPIHRDSAYTAGMAMGRRAKPRQPQADLWIAHTQLPRTVGHPFYEAEPVAGGARVRGIRRKRVWALLRGDDGASVVDAGAVFSLAADRIFRRHRWRARDCMAGSGFAGAAAISGIGVERTAAGSLNDFAD